MKYIANCNMYMPWFTHLLLIKLCKNFDSFTFFKIKELYLSHYHQIYKI